MFLKDILYGTEQFTRQGAPDRVWIGVGNVALSNWRCFYLVHRHKKPYF